MSSHHFVREGQEPALVIAIGSPASHPLFEQLTGWNPIIISFDRIMPHLEAAGISCDHVLVSGRREDWDTLLHGRTVVHESAPDEFPEVISNILSSFDCRSVRYLTDVEEDFASWEKMAGYFDITVLTPTMVWVYARTGSFKKWLPEGSAVRLYGDRAFNVNGENVQGNDLQVKRDSMYHVAAEKPFWWGELFTG